MDNIKHIPQIAIVETKDEDICPETDDGKHQVTHGSCDMCGAKNFN